MQSLLLPMSYVMGLMAGLALVPVLIHLINLLRHRRVKWAAMEFLLQSHKKHRNWIRLRQLILLLLRMAAMVAAAAMLAQLATIDRWANIFGGKATHHYVLLDDSYSMSDRANGDSAFDRARNVVSRIASQAASQETTQKLTLIRFSRAAAGGSSSDDTKPADDVADLSGVPVDDQFEELLEEKRRTFDVTELAVGPTQAVHLVREMMDQSEDENRVVYVVSDFRAGQWQNPADLQDDLQKFQEMEAEIHLVDCVRTQRPNLGITALAPVEATRAAGVPLFVQVRVKNFGEHPAKKVALKIRSLYYDPAQQDLDNARDIKAEAVVLPTVEIDEIAPGETATRRVQVYFRTGGKHVVEAILPDDPVEADNRRYCAIDFPEGVPVLIVDGAPPPRNGAYYLDSYFQPSGRVRTGIRPEIKTAAFLRDSLPEALLAYKVIYLVNVPSLDDRAVANLESFVAGGGGLAVFLGPESQIDFYDRSDVAGDRTAKNGENDKETSPEKPLLPLLEGWRLLASVPVDDSPEFMAGKHLAFAKLTGEGNQYLRGVRIGAYVKAAKNESADPQSTETVLARLHNGDPLIVERRLGQGRIMVFLTSLAPTWNNWARCESFGVMIPELQSYLESPGRSVPERLVGTPIDLQLEETTYRSDLSFFVPGDTAQTRRQIDKHAQRPSEGSPVLITSLGRSDAAGGSNGETDRRGVYEAWKVTKEGESEVLRYALNVDPHEGDLAVVASSRLAESLSPIKFDFHRWEEIGFDLVDQPGSNWSDLFMVILICLLLGEQVMAYAASYHPARGGTP